MEVPQLFTLGLPVIVTPLVGWLNQPNMPRWLRCLVATVVIVVVAVLWAVYIRTLTANVIEDIILLSAYCSALIVGPLQPLYDFALAKIPGPFAMFFKQPTVTTPPTVRDLTTRQ